MSASLIGWLGSSRFQTVRRYFVNVACGLGVATGGAIFRVAATMSQWGQKRHIYSTSERSLCRGRYFPSGVLGPVLFTHWADWRQSTGRRPSQNHGLVGRRAEPAASMIPSACDPVASPAEPWAFSVGVHAHPTSFRVGQFSTSNSAEIQTANTNVGSGAFVGTV